MPKFIKFSIVVSVLLWGLWVYLLFFGIYPSSYKEIFLFLLVLFLALGMTISFVFYFIYKKRYPKFGEDRVLYKKASKWAFFLSFGVIGVALLDAFHLMTLLNAGLFGLLYIGIFFQVRGRK